MANYIMETAQDLGNNVNLWVTWLIIFACGLLLLLLVLLILRKVMLWYWKVDLQVNTLKEIDEKLTALETEIKEKAIPIYADDESHFLEDVTLADDSFIFEQDEQDAQSIEAVFCVSKSGRLYTEKELEELIRN
jgi:hypothetical protein